MARSIPAELLRAAATLLVAIYLLALVPILLFGIVAKMDYDHLDCPAANQCSDAASVMTLAVLYVLAAPVLALLFTLLRAAARAVEAQEKA